MRTELEVRAMDTQDDPELAIYVTIRPCAGACGFHAFATIEQAEEFASQLMKRAAEARAIVAETGTPKEGA